MVLTESLDLPSPPSEGGGTSVISPKESSVAASQQQQQQQHHCPYAVALQHEDGVEASDDDDDSSAAAAGTGSADLLEETKRSCPAFGQGSCPFSAAKSAEDVRQTLLQVPPSHFEPSGKFYAVLREMHRVRETLSTASAAAAAVGGGDSNNNNNNNVGGAGGPGNSVASTAVAAALKEEFLLPGGCPVQSVIAAAAASSSARKDDDNAAAAAATPVSFTEAMESYSLAAIMARLARESGDATDEDEDEAGGGSKEQEGGPGENKESLEGRGTENAETATAPGSSSSVSERFRSSSSSEVVVDGADGKQNRVLLSQCLKTGTAVSHAAAENVHFVKNFIRGKIDRTLYGQLVIDLYHVYIALERALDRHAETYFPSCHFPSQLRRSDALKEDLDFWHGLPHGDDNGDDGNADAMMERRFPMTAATRDYVDRIRYLSSSDGEMKNKKKSALSTPLLLLAHAYTRYLGDLSGGRTLARVARKALRLDRGEGLAFYHFDAIDSPKRFKDGYRRAMDDLSLTAEQIAAMVAEANVAFSLNIRIFEELDVQAGVDGAVVRPLREALAFAEEDDDDDNKGDTGDEHLHRGAPTGKCPFVDLAAGAGMTEGNGRGGRGSRQPELSARPEVGTVAANAKGKCPWPFILAHDPAEGLRDWKSWLVLGWVLCWFWSLWMKQQQQVLETQNQA